MGHMVDLVATLRNGQADRAASELLANVVEQVQRTGKKGSVTVKFVISMVKDGDGEMEVEAKLSHSVPTKDISKGIYYADKDGKLVRENPRQISMLDDDGKTVDLSARRMGERDNFPGVRGDQL